MATRQERGKSMKNSDGYFVGFDISEKDMSVATIIRRTEDGRMQVVRTLFGKDADEFYKLFEEDERSITI